MKSFITPSYIFTPGISGVGTIDLLGIENFNIKRLVAIININSNVIIYNVASSTAGFTAVNNTTITLDYDTSAMSSNDLLQVIYDNDDAITNNELIQAVQAMRMGIQSLNRTIGLAQTNATNGALYVDGSRATQPVSGSLSSVSQVSLVTNTQQVGGQNTNSFVPSFERMTADNLRRNINVT
jgi:hypothetical protein